MSTELRTVLETPPGFASREVARFLWQMDEQRERLHEAFADLSPEALAWQAHPGVNTIGMLLAHIAWTEVNLAQVGLAGEAAGHAADVLGLLEAEVGMPLAPAGAPPAALAGRTASQFRDLLLRAREHTRRIARTLDDDALAQEVRRPPRPDGTVRVFDRAWVLYHLLEHEAGHRAQVLLLRHLMADRPL